MSGALLWTLVLLPAVPGGVLALAGGDRDGRDRDGRWGRTAGVVALAVAAATAVLALLAAVHRPRATADFLPGGPLALAVDGLSAVVIVTVSAVGLLVLLFATADIDAGRPRFFGLMLLFLAAVLLTATATTLTGLLLAWEVMGATSYGLIAFHWRTDGPPAAGTVAFLTTRTGDVGLYLAAGAALAGGGTFALDTLPGLAGGWRQLAAAGVLAAALGKAAQLPFSFWLSRAMLGPSPVSALLHSAAMVAMGGYLLLRLHPLLSATGWAADVAAWTGALTALALGAVALAQRDLKQLLAASTAAQLGFVVLAAGAGALAGGTAHLVAHAAVKALLFLTAGAWLTTRGTQRLRALRGAARPDRSVGLPFTVGALALAGVPPLSLWATKDEILAGVEHPALYGVALGAAVLSAGYAGKALGLLLRPPERARRRLRAPRPAERLPLAVLALGAAVLGVLALPALGGDRLKAVLGVPGEPAAGAGTMVVTAALAVAVTTGAVLLADRLPEPARARNWLGLEAAARALVVRPVLAAAGALARFDDTVVDRAVAAAPRAVRRLAGWTARADRGGVDGLVRGVATGTRRLGAAALRPQTGQLHQYYAQAVALLAASVALLLLLR
ncbi:proton-conducting transporter transmembrane domain-containing protein [Streptomyces sp. GSL17-111]|uniref:proton-conducting transporter transmembrane domain-containing protein n=1 Tax=Streptomyces sp. GSL17-111 TaxID=3121596 RepID=UPI0030F49E04